MLGQEITALGTHFHTTTHYIDLQDEAFINLFSDSPGHNIFLSSKQNRQKTNGRANIYIQAMEIQEASAIENIDLST